VILNGQAQQQRELDQKKRQIDEQIAQRQRDLDQKDKKIEELDDNGASQGFKRLHKVGSRC